MVLKNGKEDTLHIHTHSTGRGTDLQYGNDDQIF